MAGDIDARDQGSGTYSAYHTSPGARLVDVVFK